MAFLRSLFGSALSTVMIDGERYEVSLAELRYRIIKRHANGVAALVRQQPSLATVGGG